jgi:hypothetical protein
VRAVIQYNRFSVRNRVHWYAWLVFDRSPLLSVWRALCVSSFVGVFVQHVRTGNLSGL